jgi:hypothetical protein
LALLKSSFSLIKPVESKMSVRQTRSQRNQLAEAPNLGISAGARTSASNKLAINSAMDHIHAVAEKKVEKPSTDPAEQQVLVMQSVTPFPCAVIFRLLSGHN